MELHSAQICSEQLRITLPETLHLNFALTTGTLKLKCNLSHRALTGVSLGLLGNAIAGLHYSVPTPPT